MRTAHAFFVGICVTLAGVITLLVLNVLSCTFAPAAFKMEGTPGSGGERCDYEWGLPPGEPPLPVVHDSKPGCPAGDVCFERAQFDNLLKGIQTIQRDEASIRSLWILNNNEYRKECPK